MDQLERVVQGDCVVPEKLWLGEDTSRQFGGGHSRKNVEDGGGPVLVTKITCHVTYQYIFRPMLV